MGDVSVSDSLAGSLVRHVGTAGFVLQRCSGVCLLRVMVVAMRQTPLLSVLLAPVTSVSMAFTPALSQFWIGAKLNSGVSSGHSHSHLGRGLAYLECPSQRGRLTLLAFVMVSILLAAPLPVVSTLDSPRDLQVWVGASPSISWFDANLNV